MEEDTFMALAHALREGLTRDDRRGAPILYRLLRPTDDVVAMTDLLHRAYAPLVDRNYALHTANPDAPFSTSRRPVRSGRCVTVCPTAR